MTTVRIATFNLENFDETGPEERPSLEERIALMRPQLTRLRADIACFQEVHGQERSGQPRALLALRSLLEGTDLDSAQMVSTVAPDGGVFDERNLVVATHHRITSHEQIQNKFVAQPLYKRLTANPQTPRPSRSPSNDPSCMSRSRSTAGCSTSSTCT